MKKRRLNPEQIIVPGEYELGNESILKIYFRIFEKGHGGCLPPVIVTRSNVNIEDLEPGLEYKRTIKFITECEQKGIEPSNVGPLGKIVAYKYSEYGRYRYVNRVSAEKRFQERISGEYLDILEKLSFLRSDGAEYILLDGNHKTATATLTHNKISALEIETDNDLKEVRRMVKQGKLFDFKREETDLTSLVASFYDFCKNKLDKFNTVKERIEELIENKDLPQYMTDKYLNSLRQ